MGAGKAEATGLSREEERAWRRGYRENQGAPAITVNGLAVIMHSSQLSVWPAVPVKLGGLLYIHLQSSWTFYVNKPLIHPTSLSHSLDSFHTIISKHFTPT